jgi:hypothetical protein
VAEGGGLLNVDQSLGHLCFSSQILPFQSLPQSSDLAAVGSGGPVERAHRDNFGDSLTIVERSRAERYDAGCVRRA